ncbi:hypothetical protein [Kordia jejudonensis]|uniref:hypothetical protein n=1 Tax=Kordia jejudonensis TaxID=1348245 RepID=UPI000629B9BB|nr:hypothetical protein [Kordia jejudonensis]
MNDQKITGKYIVITTIAVLFTWLLHEFTHWCTSELLGFTAMMQINASSIVSSEQLTPLQATIISISGPIMTILQAILIYFVLMKKTWNKHLYPFLFISFYMRFLAGMMNFINLNDEGRVSNYLEIGTFTLPIIVSALLFFLVYQISRTYKLHWKFQAVTYIIVMIVSSIVILADQFFKIRII